MRQLLNLEVPSNKVAIILSSETLRTKLTFKERTDLFLELLGDLDIDTYEILDGYGNWVGRNMDKAISDLQKAEKLSRWHGW